MAKQYGFFEFATKDRVASNRGKCRGSMIDDMASEMRRQIDKYDVSWDYARDEAIREIIEKELKERGSAE